MSGLIYGAIVVIWAAVLVPMWLRRHDEAVEAKSVDRFSTAMKVLARRTTAPDVGAVQTVGSVGDTPTPYDFDGAEDRVEAPRRGGRLAALPGAVRRRTSDSRVLASIGRSAVAPYVSVRRRMHRADHAVAPSTAGGATAVVAPRRRASMAVRRQRVLAVLLALTVVAGVLAGFAVVPWVAAVPVGLLLIGYLVLLRTYARRAAGTTRSAESSRREEAIAPASLDSASHTVKVNPAPVRRPADPVSADAASPAHDVEPVAAAAGSPDGRSTPAPDGFLGPRLGWDPVPVPSPTYVNAPRAPRAVRSIDLSADGAWTSGRLVADARAAAAAAVARSSQRDADSEPSRRAVGD